MELILLRHAEKQSGFQEDPPLTERGLRQAQMLSELVEQTQLPQPSRLLSSPKKRAQQTLETLARQKALALQIVSDLQERRDNENRDEFRSRVQRFLRELSKGSGITYVCSHVDWVFEALRLIPCDVDLQTLPYQSWPTGHFMVLEWDHGLWKFIKQGDLQL
ncbi:MAG: histidine phosphatase family protein [Proteobacteria bacterium]|jgi:phosphohistidine phosphatase SixA|nr:histidine phosphatase family protein [Pseudomonadota bacterium]